MGWYLYKRQIFQEISLTFKWLETTAAFEHTNGPERNNDHIESCPPENGMSNYSVTIHTIKTTKINCSKMLQQICIYIYIYDICLQQVGFISICINRIKGVLPCNYFTARKCSCPKNNTKMRLVPSFWLKIASDSWYSTSPEANLEIKTSMGCCKGIPQETSRNHSCSIPFVDVQAIPGIQDDKPWSLLGTNCF